MHNSAHSKTADRTETARLAAGRSAHASPKPALANPLVVARCGTSGVGWATQIVTLQQSDHFEDAVDGTPRRYAAARHRHEPVERIYDAVSRFVMIDKDILRQALLASPRDLGEEAPAEILPIFSL
jgi:hypothetical protein